MKYLYLLQNQYDQVSNLHKRARNCSTAEGEEGNSPTVRRNSSKDDLPPMFGGLTEESKADEQMKTSVSSKK